MPQYLVLIYENENGWAEADKAMWDQAMADHGVFAQAAGAAVKGGEALQPTSTATTILKDGAGGFTVTDGPFVETKEALGGYYLIEAADLDAAIALAKQVPAPFGGVEVRPIMTFN